MTSAYEVSSAVLTHPGRKRHHNEDFVAFFEPEDPIERQNSGRLYIVADGVGGEAKGEKASQYAAQKVLYDFYNDVDPDVGARLRRAIVRAGNEIHSHASRSGGMMRMATTMVAAVVRNGLLTIANVGDSRAYLIRNGSATQITRDHTIAGELLRDGEVTEEEAMRVKGKNRLTRSLGGEPDVHVDVFPDIQLESGDRILLCSDGLARYTLHEDIEALAAEGNADDVTHRAIDYANKRGGADNITVALIDVGQTLGWDVPTVRRGDQPTLVDWDSMLTEPQAVGVPRRRRRKSISRGVFIGFAGLVVIALAAVGIFLLIGPKLLASSDATPTDQALLPTNTLVASDSGVVAQPTATQEPSATATPPRTPDVRPPRTPLKETGEICIYTAKVGDTLTNIITKIFPNMNEDEMNSLAWQVYDYFTEELVENPDKIQATYQYGFDFVTADQCELILDGIIEDDPRIDADPSSP